MKDDHTVPDFEGYVERLILRRINSGALEPSDYVTKLKIMNEVGSKVLPQYTVSDLPRRIHSDRQEVWASMTVGKTETTIHLQFVYYWE